MYDIEIVFFSPKKSKSHNAELMISLDLELVNADFIHLYDSDVALFQRRINKS